MQQLVAARVGGDGRYGVTVTLGSAPSSSTFSKLLKDMVAGLAGEVKRFLMVNVQLAVLAGTSTEATILCPPTLSDVVMQGAVNASAL